MEVGSFCAITGASEDVAQHYLTAYGSLESASNAFFDGRVPAALQNDEAAPAEVREPAFVVPEGEWYELVWGRREKISAAWLEQTFQRWEGAGLVQDLNGPCGLLCVLNAVLVVRLLLSERDRLQRSLSGVDDEQEGSFFCVEEVLDALATIIERCTNPSLDDDTAPGERNNNNNNNQQNQDRNVVNSVCRIATWKNGVIGGDVDVATIPCGEPLREFLSDHEEAFIGKGCCPLLLYSCVFTRGVDKIKTRLVESDEKSLVAGPFWLGTTEMMTLLLVGDVRVNIMGYNNAGAKNTLLPRSDVGLLTFEEVETGIAICDSLKHPSFPVWIIHGGDHFSLAFCLEQPPEFEDAEFEMFHWNGLPPGKAMQKIRVCATDGVVAPLPDRCENTYYKPRVGEIDEVIQAHPDDRAKSDYYSDWRFEVILAVDNKDETSALRPEEMQDDYPIYELAAPPRGAWRCAACYRTRYKTMCFGLNQDSTQDCVHCGKSMEEAGWTVYFRYRDLPKTIRVRIQKHYGHKILSVLRTRWKNCDCIWQDDDNVPSC